MTRLGPTHRYAEKRERWLRWLGYWGYSTMQVFPAVVGANANLRHHAWMRGLRDDGLMQITRGLIGYPLVSVYGLTELGRAFAGLSADHPVLTHRQIKGRLQRPTALHDLAVQAYVAPMDGRPGYDIALNGHSIRPDAFVGTTAIELERTPKSDPRIFRIYLNYAHLMLDAQVERVRFVFPHESMTSRYRRLFERTEWQDTVLDPSGKRYVPTSDPFHVAPDHDIRKRFEFSTESLWLCP